MSKDVRQALLEVLGNYCLEKGQECKCVFMQVLKEFCGLSL